MDISSPRIYQEKDDVVFSADVNCSEGSHTLWYRLDNVFADFLVDSCDAPLVALLIPAMRNGEDIFISGRISERLMYNLSGAYQRVLQEVMPFLRRIKIHAQDVYSGVQRSPGVATGFSAGIDSYCVLADHYYSNVTEGFKITHLLFNNVGSHGLGGGEVFRARYQRLRPISEKIGLPLIKIDSNVDEFYQLGFRQTHTTRNASVAHLLQGGIGRYMYASAYSYADAFVGEADGMAYSDTVALPLLSTDAVDTFSVGSEYTRVEKTLRVADISDSYSTLDVCVNDSYALQHKTPNCSNCWKCKRTLLTLEVAGVIDRYAESFDLDLYAKYRDNYVRAVLKSRDPLLREIIRFAALRNYKFPFLSRLYARMPRLVRVPACLPIHIARKLRRMTWK